MDNQKFFELAATGMLKQGTRYMRRLGECVYRGPNGLKCGVGHAIPDNEYTDQMDCGWNLAQVLARCPSLREVNFNLANRAQEIHDGEDTHQWYEHLVSLGKAFNLDCGFLDTLPKVSASTNS